MSPEEIENQLVQLLKDEQKREQVIRKCATFVLKNGGNWEDAKEVFSQAIFSVLAKVKRGDASISGGNVSAYLNGVCRNIWLSRFRKKKEVQPLRGRDGKVMNIEDTNNGLLEKAEQENQYQLMEACLKELGERCQTILNSFYYEKKSYKEIAQLVDVTEANARKVAERCRVRLKNCVQAKQ